MASLRGAEDSDGDGEKEKEWDETDDDDDEEEEEEEEEEDDEDEDDDDDEEDAFLKRRLNRGQNRKVRKRRPTRSIFWASAALLHEFRVLRLSHWLEWK